MNIVIIGIGKVGITLVDQLSKEGHNLVVIDNDKKVVEKTINDFDIMGILGNGADYDIQNEAKVNTADLCIACTSSDELNILCCMVAKKLGAADTIARIRNPEYFTLFMGRELGLSLMVNPEYEAAMEIFRILRSPGAIKIEPFANGKIDLVEFKLTANSPIANKKVFEISQILQTHMLICAIQRGEEVFIPDGNFTLLENDKLYVFDIPKNIYLILRKLKIYKSEVKNVTIVGGSRIAFYLAKELDKINIDVKILEKNEQKSQFLSETLPHADIVLGDGSESDILIDEGALRSDAIIVLTGSDEENVMISLFANANKAKKVIVKINRFSYYSILEASGIESIISPRLLTSNHIVRYVRSKQNAHGSAVLNLFKIVNDKAEALEFLATEKFVALSTPLKDIRFKKNILIACILRGDDIISPGGNATIEQDDKVILVTTNQLLDDLNDILE
jgi:trk system potassium uptake protein TrkA